MKNKERGITLIALVITIVILIILAGVAINLTLGDNGIFKKATTAREDYGIAAAKEKIELKIAELQAEKKGKATLEELVEYLKDDPNIDYTVSLTEITASLTSDIIVEDAEEIYVVYNKYQFKIKKNLEVQYISRVEIDTTTSTIINNFELNITNANGEYLTIDASSATTNNGSEIKEYRYIVNEEEKAVTTQKQCTINKLELSTEYKIKVIAVDENDKIKESTIKKFTTSNKQYLYNNGDKCENMTGGYTTGATSGATITYNTDNIQISTTGYYYAFSVTNNKIDLTKYQKLCTISTTNTNTWSVRLGANKGDTGTYMYTIGQIGERIYKEIDISTINQSLYLKLGKNNASAGTINYYQIWLEKSEN